MEKIYLATQLTADQNTLTGYAALFNSPVDRTDYRGRPYVLSIAPTAFNETLASGEQFMYLNHDPNIRLARTGKNLKLWTDDKGLAFKAELPPTTQAADLKVLIQHGIIGGMSVGFDIVDDEWDNGEIPHRLAKAVKLDEVSPVYEPADINTSVDLLSVQLAKKRLNRHGLKRHWINFLRGLNT